MVGDVNVQPPRPSERPSQELSDSSRVHLHAIVFSVSKTVTLRLDETTYEELKEAARAENRPLSNLIQTAALAKVREHQFVDDAEMAEILEDESLLHRLKAGSGDARLRKGRFID